MKNLSFIILGTIAVALIGLAVWQLMWMSDVVDNYDAARSYKGSENEVNIKKDKFQDKGTNAVITDQPAEEKAVTVVDSSGIKTKSEIENVDKEEQATVVPAQPLNSGSKEEKSISANKPHAVSIKHKSDKPLPPKKQVITNIPISSGQPLNIPARPATQHATSTSPY